MDTRGRLVEEARKRAEDVLWGNAREIGLLSARHAYQQVNGRDAMISGLGLLLLDNPEAREVHRHSIETLASGQSRLGCPTWAFGTTPSDSTPWAICWPCCWISPAPSSQTGFWTTPTPWG
ncbi:MAG: hypothetical protein ACYC66_09255 [Chloroflexota bacterium]